MADFDPIASGQAIGQGLAQIVGPFEDKYGALAAKEASETKKKESERQKSLLSDLSAMKKIDILSGDQTAFAEKQAKIYDFTKKNIDALLSGDADKTLEFNQMMTQFATDAAHSKNYRENHEQVSRLMLANRPKFDDAAFQALENDRKSSFDDQGKYKDIDVNAYTMLKKPVDLNEYFRKQMGDRIDVKNKKYKTKVMENGKYILKTFDLNTPEDVKTVYDAIYDAAPQEIKDEIDIKFGQATDEDLQTIDNAQDYGYNILGKPYEKDVIGTEETKIPTRAPARVRATRTTTGGAKPKIDLMGAADQNLPHWNRAWKQGGKGEITEPNQSSVTAYTIPFTKELNLQLVASKMYVPFKSEDNRQTGSWITQPTNEKISFSNIQFVPVVKDITGNERFLDQSEVASGKIKNSDRPLKNPRMKAVIPFTKGNQNYYIDAEENQVKNKIKAVTGEGVPTWDQVRASLKEKGITVPSWADGGGGSGGGGVKEYTIKGKKYSANQVEAKAKESNMTTEEYVKALNEIK